MVETHVVSALIEKRARVAGELHATQLRAMRLKRDLVSIDACIRMFKEGFDPTTIKPKVTILRRAAKLPKGAGTRAALDILRQCGEPLTTQELARRVLLSQGMEPDHATVRFLTASIQSSFSRQTNPVVGFDRSSWPGKWFLVPPPSRA